MSNPQLSSFVLGGQQLDISDSVSRQIATQAQSTAESAQSTATQAQNTATQAQSTAESVQSTATQAQNTATQAKSTATQAKSTATQAQNTATQAQNTATQAQSTATQAQNTATQAQNTAESIAAGFNTQFEQKTGEYISPYFCKRNNTVYVEFTNIAPNKIINHGTWKTVCFLKSAHIPVSTIYRNISVGGTITVLVEVNTGGTMKMYSPTTDIPLNGKFFGGFSYLTI